MKQLITISRNEGSYFSPVLRKFQIKAETFSKFPGLAIHRNTDKKWTVTHMHSGLAIYRKFRLKKQAMEFIRQIHGTTDWTLCASKVNTTKVSKLCRKAMESIMHEPY